MLFDLLLLTPAVCLDLGISNYLPCDSLEKKKREQNKDNSKYGSFFRSLEVTRYHRKPGEVRMVTQHTLTSMKQGSQLPGK